MTKTEIIKQAKHYFGNDRTFIKDLVLTYKFNGENYKKWKADINLIIPNPNEIQYKLFEDVILWIKEGKAKEINWNWIGDLSWTIEILLNENVDKGYDWDKKLALKCNGTARILQVFVSDIIPCYTYDLYYMTFDKKNDYYEFGPITKLTQDEKNILTSVKKLLKNKKLQYVNKEFCEKKFKDLYSDCNSDGNASLFDVLFTDSNYYTTETKRFCDKGITEKNGNTLTWHEKYNKNGKLLERTELRRFQSSDYLRTVLDDKGHIKEVVVTRNIEKEKHQEFTLDIVKEYNSRKSKTTKNKNSS